MVHKRGSGKFRRIDNEKSASGKLWVPVAFATGSGRITSYPEVETDGRGEDTMIFVGETEAGSAGTQPC